MSHDQNPKNKIVIKFNGGEKHFYTENDERLLSIDETAAASEEAEESFDWILPEPAGPDEKNSLSPYIVKSQPKKARFNFKVLKPGALIPSMWVSIILAVIVGTSLGFIALKTVTGKDQTQSEQAAAEAGAAPAATAQREKALEAAGQSLPVLKAYVVQGGIYSTKKSAEGVQAELQSKGTEAVMLEQDGRFILIIGAADSLGAAKNLSLFMKEKKLDSFWKELDIGRNPAKKISTGDSVALKNMNNVYGMLAEKSSEKLMNPQAADDAGGLQAAVKQMEDREKPQNKNIADMQAALKKASSIYLSSADTSSLMQAQAKLLDYLKLYSAL
ncbi:SPOR domain-containing protein [Peribacillus sp. SCS-37]|uniref:SPOR domain-containing protein n=1 Tax=Paraperibacillus esterisolvens TaxID=3115296 RepID=UPI0039063D0D